MSTPLSPRSVSRPVSPRPVSPRPVSPQPERSQSEQSQPEDRPVQPEEGGKPWVRRPFDPVRESYKVVKSSTRCEVFKFTTCPEVITNL